MSKVGITEVVLRDGNQSLISTRLTLEDILPIASAIDEIGFWSIESWGGATFDVCLRHLNEDPWERLRQLKKAMPNTPQQMLLRGQNLVGYKHFSDQIVAKFINKSAENGIDVYRVFDALNDINNIRFSILQVKENNKHAQAAMAYTTSPIHNLNYWVDLAKNMEDLGADSIAIKDMSGILKPYDAFDLVSKLKKEISLPVHMQTHATTGMSAATNLKAIEAGIDNIDTSISSMSMTYGHSATETLVSILKDTDYSSNLDLLKLDKISEYFKNLRSKYSEFEGSLKGVDVQMLIRQVPGGMLSNLETQLKELKQEENLNKVINEIPVVRKDLGYPPLVTPVSQIVGAQALANVIDKQRYKNISIEMINLISGWYGKLFGEVSEDLKQLAKEKKEPITSRPADFIENNFEESKKDLQNFCKKNSLKDLSKSEENILSFALFPYSASDFFNTSANESSLN
ncbi:pyruvate carboxylase subunit B [SAR86 cluster bacterium]|nr:pyruvate carboxylase subunit B [SAR86 cluster bacterium]